jgi:hypothetical protein
MRTVPVENAINESLFRAEEIDRQGWARMPAMSVANDEAPR